MTTLRAEKTYERYAWILLLLTGIFTIPPTFFNLVMPTEATLGTLVSGLSLLAFTLLTIGISITGYRKGRRWAWFVLWYVPVSLGLAAYDQYVTGYGVGLVFVMGLAIAGLLLPYRKFFPRKEVRTGSLDA
ncbi:MAG TPA: hypothetical protein VFE98_05225 [Candidatus Bathyarchaeia archaeon]|nr:hypothetical protein [Candidatus Bathyarchaeia archaeon]